MKTLIMWNDGSTEVVLRLTETQREKLGQFKQFYVTRFGTIQSVYVNGTTQAVKE